MKITRRLIQCTESDTSTLSISITVLENERRSIHELLVNELAHGWVLSDVLRAVADGLEKQTQFIRATKGAV